MKLPIQQAPAAGCSRCGEAADCHGHTKDRGGEAGGLGDGRVVLLAGNPNAGKTTVFNALSGAKARVGNYPGITVDRRSALLRLPGGEAVELVDLPGTYSLTARSPEEQVAADAVLGRFAAVPDAVIVVADASTLSRNLYIALQVIESGARVVLALNMMDEAARAGVRIDPEQLERRLGVPVVPMAAAKGQGIDALREAVERALAEAQRPEPLQLELGARLEQDVAEMEAAVARALPELPATSRRPWALWLLLSVGDDELQGVSDELRALALAIQERARERGGDLDLEIIGARYAYIDSVTAGAVRHEAEPARSLTDRLDSVFTHPVWGFSLFALVMLVLFEALFTWAEPFMGWVELAIGAAQGITQGLIGPGLLRDLLQHGVIQGVGNVLVFVPQIALLFLFIAFLEDSGYLARVAFMIDPIMSRLGLHGRAFVPLLSGFACAVPAVLATRTIESRRDRLLTMLALPLMTCSARLPVYVLVIGTVFAGQGRVFGVLSAGAAALFAMYIVSVAATLGTAALFGRTVLPGRRPALVLELPPYRLPVLRNLATAVWQRVKTFLRDAGTIILAITIVLWALLSFPHSDEIDHRFEAAEHSARAEFSGEALEEKLSALRGQHAGDQLAFSIAGRVGHAMEPAIEPLGFDWRIGVGILGAFAAREVFVSTLGMVFGIEEADEASTPLRDALRDARRADGEKLMTPVSGASLMVFFVLACQCMSTIAVVWRESGSLKWPMLMLGYMTALAYGAALLVYQVGTAIWS
ncbi:MAG: ferrous iron transport protein B [Myxococcales bacterium]|nr:ferrous iron transport protein B [Myxococcales bacterium]